MKIIITPLLVCIFLSHASAQTEVPYAWIQGSWVGDGFGGTSEEVWSGPSPDGALMGAYRHFNQNGKLNFYEFLKLDSTGLTLKHFDAAFVGWEEKDDFLFFEMVECTNDKIVLKGLVFERTSDTEMKIFLKMKSGDKFRTEVFTMKRGSLSQGD